MPPACHQFKPIICFVLYKLDVVENCSAQHRLTSPLSMSHSFPQSLGWLASNNSIELTPSLGTSFSQVCGPHPMTSGLRVQAQVNTEEPCRTAPIFTGASLWFIFFLCPVLLLLSLTSVFPESASQNISCTPVSASKSSS